MKLRIIDWKYFVSLLAFLALVISANLVGICIAVLLVVLLAPLCQADKGEKTDFKFQTKYAVWTGIAVSIMAGLFYFRWLPSGLIGTVASVLHVATKIFLVIPSAVLAVVALPFVYRGIYLISNKGDQKIRGISDFMDGTKFLWTCGMIFTLGIGVMVACCFTQSAWLDELFTLRMIGYSYGRIIELCSMDVHVPVYYFITKTVTDLLHACLPAVPVVYFAKLSSVIPYILMGVLAFTVIRKNWGKYTAGLFLICLIGMPRMLNYGIEMRMYSWAMLFLLSALLCANGIVQHNKVGTWVLLVGCSLLAAYTHHYSLISVAAVWLGLLIWHIADKERKVWVCLIWGVVTASGYLPWLYILIGQLKYVDNSYWIADITPKTVYSYFTFLFQNLMVLAVFVIALVTAVKKVKKSDTKEYGIALVGMGVVFFVLTVGLVVSLAFKPIFVARYMLPGFACLWLGISIVYAVKNNKLLKYLVVVFAVVSVLSNTQVFVQDVVQDNRNAVQLREELKKYEGYLVVSTEDFVNREIAVITDNDCYLWSGDAEILMETVYNNIYDLNEDANAIRQWLADGEKIIFVSITGEDAEICEEMTQTHGFTLTKLGDYVAGAKEIVNNITIYELTAGS